MATDEIATERSTVIAVAASAGGIRALQEVLGGLGADLPVPVLVVQHLDPSRATILPRILQRHCALRIALARGRDRTRPGTAYVAPPARHLLVAEPGVLTLSDQPPVHFVRPSADLLFRSVAEAYGPRAVACVLTGTGTDGAAGAAEIGKQGGRVLVQDPETAEFRGMPDAALREVPTGLVLPLEEIAAVLRGLVETKRQ